jgi:hypothetical protein
MEPRSSLWRGLRVLLTFGVVGAATTREDWAIIRQISNWGNTRRFRRIVVLLWIGLLAVDPWMMVRISQRFAILASLPALLLPTLSQLLITWLAFRSMCIGLAQPTVEDSAQLLFGADFEALSNRQRDELIQRRSRNFIFGRVHKDERENELRARAEVAAYRVLRHGLVVAGVTYWAICLLGPFESTRGTLVVTAIGYTWLAVAILVLPTMIRMWTQPNEAGETRIVSTANDV